MNKLVRCLLCVLIFVYAQSCTPPESMEMELIEEYGGDTTTIHLSQDLESYITGKCLMVSFERQDYSILYSQLTVDTAYADADWITITRHSTYVTVTVEENYTPEYRNCYAYYRLIGSEKFDTVIVSQGPKDMFFITNANNNDGYILDFKEHNVYFDVFSNVDYTIEIPDSAKDWIKLIVPPKTKSIFVDTRFGITVLANDGNYRDTYIRITSKKSSVYQSIKIAQDGKYYTLDRAIANNPNLSIFYQAIESTGLKDTLQLYYDYTYPEVEEEWTLYGLTWGQNTHKHSISYETDWEVIPEKREFKFTVFIVPDSVLAADYNIHSVEELREFAKTVYPEGKDLDDIDRGSSLNKLLSYHILPCWLSYDQFNVSQDAIVKKHNDKETLDVEDFYETLMPHSVMRISSAYKGSSKSDRIGIFINRKGTTKNKNLVAPGIKIIEGLQGEYKGYDKICRNGEYHFVEKLLVYDDYTRNVALNCRMRIMASTLSPDFINSGGRGRMFTEGKRIVYKYLPGFCKNFEWLPDQSQFYVRYRDASFNTFNGDEITVCGNYDIAFKLPPVPSDGRYEVRVWNNAAEGTAVADRGIVQFFFHECNPSDASTSWRSWNWIPEGNPVDLTISGSDSRIGWVKDSDYDQYDDKEALIEANDRSMRYRGYMKAPDSYGRLRDDRNCYRKIVANEYMRANTDYWIRIRQVYLGGMGVFPFNFIEIVPKSIYENNEDRH